MRKRPVIVLWILAMAVVLLPNKTALAAEPQSSGPKFEISFPASVQAGPITGRVFVMISQRDIPEPRLQAGSWGDTAPFFGVDVSALAAGKGVRFAKLP